MNQFAGVYAAVKKDGSRYYRASITHRGIHISLGSFSTPETAAAAYQLAQQLLTDGRRFDPHSPFLEIEHHTALGTPLSFEKWVALINLRDNGLYCRNPIYLRPTLFYYYLDATTALKFDVDDLFYYRKHKILRRGGHLFAADYGMQVNLLSRYGIRNYAVAGRDYRFVNGDETDFRYNNIEIFSHYHGVICLANPHSAIESRATRTEARAPYLVKIHVNGDHVVGRYQTEQEAAVAYNKAAALLRASGVKKNFPENYIEELSAQAYAALHARVPISKRLLAAFPPQPTN